MEILRFEDIGIIQNLLAELRISGDQINPNNFRRTLELLGTLMAYEISKEFPTEPMTVETGMRATKKQNCSMEKPVLVNILRASNPLIEGYLRIFPYSNVSFLAAARDSNLRTTIFYKAVQNLDGKVVIIPDVMLATGASLVASLDALEKYGSPRKWVVQAAIAAPEGIQALEKRMPECKLYVCSIDDHLDEKGYIVPGLGDAGDLCYGKKI